MAYNPVSTYRIQFHKEFSFEAFERIIAYLQKLGVKTIYASPIFKAVPDSNHGYDGLNPIEINSEIGSLEQLKNISGRLKDQNMGWLQDIVPNHMAFHHGNEWLMDVLEKGKHSAFASFFDIYWESKVYHGKLMVPFLGAPLKEVIQNNELRIAYENGRLVLKYYDSFYPLNPASYNFILGCEGSPPESITKLLALLEELKQINDPVVHHKQWEEFLLQYNSLQNDEESKNYINRCLDKINADHDLLQKVADEQYYALSHWQETDSRINYRRFFTVNGLICLNIQDPIVFKKYHSLVRSLAKEQIFQGLRIDHIDGLYEPEIYLQRIKEAMGEDTYVVVEKILQHGESLPHRWKAEGTTGYDFLALVNNLFTNKKNEEAFTNFYQEITDNYNSTWEQLLEKKFFILHQHMKGELDNLYDLLLSLVDKKLLSSIYPNYLKEAIAEFLIHCPAYRFYGNKFPLDEHEARAVENILGSIQYSQKVKPSVIDILRKAFLQKPNEGNVDFNSKLLHFYKRCMQFTGPLMAKGVEDTMMYTYNRFIGHNDVGDSPLSFGITPDEFNNAMSARRKQWPLSQNATSTHDTKRGEDVRARLNVLSDLPDEWFQLVQQWREMNQSLKQDNFPDANDEYFIYQILAGTYPMPDTDEQNFNQRLDEYLQKALREAKTNSDWATPNKTYETATKEFAKRLLDKNSSFWQSFSSFHQKITDFGIVNSLARVLLKFTCPGIPDVYQGCELWDLSFVDPDNRRPVDYELRLKLLEELNHDPNDENFFERLWQSRYNGQVKLWLTQTLFELRKQRTEFFERAEYIPLQVKGIYSDFVFAFARQYKEKWIVIAIPLHLAELCRQQEKEILSIDWKDTHIILPRQLKGKAEDILFKTETKIQKTISIQKLFKPLPIGLIQFEVRINERNAGILLHISSLPSKFGIGDLGLEAYAFADMLNNCNQKTWQMLPLNPVDAGQGFSPYSSISSRAGNTLLISPELLAREELIDAEKLDQMIMPQDWKINFHEVIKTRNEIFNKIWSNAKRNKKHPRWKLFKEFNNKEAEWLNDFALYTVIKIQEQGKAWFQWPEELKNRSPEALQKISTEKKDAIEKAKFLQFIFAQQWQGLKKYCNDKGIQLLGDLPIYVSYDSVDVWSNPGIFNIDDQGNLAGVAGTPPDAFSDDGQLWGMPVFKWDVLKETNYKWWIERLKRNKELFDIIRLDHFRAFAAYWEVPAQDNTAKNGSWKQGPGAEFFEAIKKEFEELPFVAEDLGDIDDAVTELRDQFNLPGMKVLHFAFDDNMPTSEYIPHNYNDNFIVYTGTHDNNTTKGWYKQNIDENAKKRIEQYFGKSLNEDNIAFEFMRLAYSSVAKTVIIPLQDVLNMDETARMNIPSSGENNWNWKLLPGQFDQEAQNRLKELVWLYNRK